MIAIHSHGCGQYRSYSFISIDYISNFFVLPMKFPLFFSNNSVAPLFDDRISFSASKNAVRMRICVVAGSSRLARHPRVTAHAPCAHFPNRKTANGAFNLCGFASSVSHYFSIVPAADTSRWVAALNGREKIIAADDNRTLSPPSQVINIGMFVISVTSRFSGRSTPTTS